MIRTLQKTVAVDKSTRLDDPIVLCAADDAYAMPLGVTLWSAAKHLPDGSRLKVFLLDGGIGDANWMALKETLADCDLDLTIIEPDRSLVQDLMTSHHISTTAYFRLLAAELLPADIDRVVYLDSDLLVCDDVSQLWGLPLGSNLCLAVPDIACPFVDARRGSKNFRKSSPYMATLCPIRNWRQLGLNGADHYFNSGLMVINLDQWRRENLAERLLRCLRDNAAHVWCWDQYALNVELAGQWGRLPMRWNQGAHAFEYPGNNHSPVEMDEFESMTNHPAIVHYTTEFKPWHYYSSHPNDRQFFETLDQTAWKNWRPERPDFKIKDSWNRGAVMAQKRATILFRKATSLWF